MYSNNDWRNYELAHHGILGMKWGKQNGPPYPLDSSDHSSSEKKAGWKKSLGGGRNEGMYGRNKKGNAKKSSLRKRFYESLANIDNDYLDPEMRGRRQKIESRSRMQSTVDNALAVKKQKKLVGKANELFGPGARITSLENEAKKYEALAKTYKDPYKKEEYERKARNARYEADSYRKSSEARNAGGAKAAKQMARDAFLSPLDRLNTKVETEDGRVITKKQAKLEEVATEYAAKMLVNTVMDAIFPTPSNGSSSINNNYFAKKPVVENNLNDVFSQSFNDFNNTANNTNYQAAQAAQEASRFSIQEANRSASLAMTNGMNPFLFG